MKNRIVSVVAGLIVSFGMLPFEASAQVVKLSFSGTGARSIFVSTEGGLTTTAEIFVSVKDAATPFLGVGLKQVSVTTGAIHFEGQGDTENIDFAVGPDFENGHLNAHVQVLDASSKALNVHLVINWVGVNSTESLAGSTKIELEDGTLTEKHAGTVRMLDTSGSIKISDPAAQSPTLTLPPSETPSIAWSSSSTGKLVTKSRTSPQGFAFSEPETKSKPRLQTLATATGYWTGYWTWTGTQWIWTWVWKYNSGGYVTS